jgi:hypothetical protein
MTAAGLRVTRRARSAGRRERGGGLLARVEALAGSELEVEWCGLKARLPGHALEKELGSCGGRGTLGNVKRGARSRLIVKLTLCTLAGAVVTWAVAWGCALWSPFAPVRSEKWEGGSDEALRAGMPALDGRYRRETRRETWGGTGYLDDRMSGRDRPLRGFETMPLFIWHRVRAGFPASALEGHCFVAGSAERPSAFYAPRWTHPRDAFGGRLLPTRIIPLGFTLNTLLAAGVLLGVVEGFAFARRRVRRAKGRCVSCGYDRGGLAGGDAAACPECGAGGLS